MVTESRETLRFLAWHSWPLELCSNILHALRLSQCWKGLLQRPSWVYFFSPVPRAGSDTKWLPNARSLNEWMNERCGAVTTPRFLPTSPLHCLYHTLHLDSLSLAFPISFAFIIALFVHNPGQITAPSQNFLDVRIHLSFLFYASSL